MTQQFNIPSGLLSKWVHPKTNEIRLYVNHPRFGGRKVWITETKTPGLEEELRGMYEFHEQGGNGDEAEETFDRIIGLIPETAVADDSPLWSELLAAAK